MLIKYVTVLPSTSKMEDLVDKGGDGSLGSFMSQI